MASLGKITIRAFDPNQVDGLDPYSKDKGLAFVAHLKPVVEFLMARGNCPLNSPQTHDQSINRYLEYIGNGWAKEGGMAQDYIYRFAEPLVFEEIMANFEFPPSINVIRGVGGAEIVDEDIHAIIR